MTNRRSKKQNPITANPADAPAKRKLRVKPLDDINLRTAEAVKGYVDEVVTEKLTRYREQAESAERSAECAVAVASQLLVYVAKITTWNTLIRHTGGRPIEKLNELTEYVVDAGNDLTQEILDITSTLPSSLGDALLEPLIAYRSTLMPEHITGVQDEDDHSNPVDSWDDILHDVIDDT